MCFPDTGNSYESGVCVCLQRPGKVRNPSEVRSSGGRGGSSGDGETGTSPPRPQLPGDAAEPPEKVCKLPAGAARTPGHLGGGRAGGLGASSLPGPKPAAATSCRAAHRRWWACAPGNEWASLSGGTCLSLQAWKARQWRGSSCLHSCSHLLPLSGSRWHHYLFPAAAPNDSSRLRRGCSSQNTAAEPSSPPDSTRKEYHRCLGNRETFLGEPVDHHSHASHVTHIPAFLTESLSALTTTSSQWDLRGN